jgi:hypothetical protein
VTSRVSELAMRRQMLVLKSERLREELVAEQFAIRQSLGGVDRALSIARGLRSPMMLLGVGAMVLRVMRGLGVLRGVRRVGGMTSWGVRALMLVSLARKGLTLFQMFRTITRARDR